MSSRRVGPSYGRKWRTSITRAACAALILAWISAPSLAAQDTSPVPHSDWVTGAPVGVPGYALDPRLSFFTVSVHGTQVRPGNLGADLSAGTMPRALLEGLLAVGARAGLAVPLALEEDVLVLPSGGAGFVAGFGSGDVIAAPGVNVGAAALVLPQASMGFRSGITWHWLRGFGNAVWLVEFGLVGR